VDEVEELVEREVVEQESEESDGWETVQGGGESAVRRYLDSGLLHRLRTKGKSKKENDAIEFEARGGRRSRARCRQP
jgi:hypothetical protein